jgi:hypothetical protein
MQSVVSLNEIPIAVREGEGLFVGTSNGTIYINNKVFKNIQCDRLYDFLFVDNMIYSSYKKDDNLILGNITTGKIYASFVMNSLDNVGAKIALTDDTLFLALGDNGLGQDAGQKEIPWGKIWSFRLNGIEDMTAFSKLSPNVYAVGIRNPAGLSVDDGRMYVTDDSYSGQKIYELRRGSNYAWNIKKGEIHCTPSASICTPNIFPMPRYTYPSGYIIGGASVLKHFYYADAPTFKVVILEEKGQFWRKIKNMYTNSYRTYIQIKGEI